MIDQHGSIARGIPVLPSIQAPQVRYMGRMRDQVDAGLVDAAPTARDAGAVELLRTYADLIDDAGVPGKYAEALDWLVGIGAASEDKAADKHVRAILLGLAGSRPPRTSDRSCWPRWKRSR
jgi:hypothetical protein